MQKILFCSLLIFFNTTIIQTAGLITPETISKTGQYASTVSKKFLKPITINRIMQYTQKGANLWKRFWQIPTDKELKFLGFKHGITSIQEKHNSSDYIPSDYLEPIHNFWQYQLQYHHIQQQLKYAQNSRLQDSYAKRDPASINNKKLDTKSKKIINLDTQRQKAHYKWLTTRNETEQQNVHENLLKKTKNLDNHIYRF